MQKTKVCPENARMIGGRQSLFSQSSCRTRRTVARERCSERTSAVNNEVQHNLMIFIASSFFAGMLVSTALAQSPREIGNNTKQDHPSYLADYAYSEIPPYKKPADIVLGSLKDIPNGTPIEEIKRASDAFGLDFHFMRAVARIESDFDPKQRTGSYIGLFQLSKDEFAKYGSGDILNARDNAVAAAYKFATAAI